MRSIDLIGETFGRLTVKSKAAPIRSPSRSHTAWICSCECGTEVVVKTNSIRTGNAKSCGCLRTDTLRAKAGPRQKNKPEYSTWARMKSRCHNTRSPDYPDYGGRGITVCDRWANSFHNFLDDMGKRPSGSHSIDRIDNNKGYSPENCRWATNAQQSRNKRNNIFISFGGRTMILQDWANELGIHWVTLHERIQKKPLEIALQPLKR